MKTLTIVIIFALIIYNVHLIPVPTDDEPELQYVIPITSSPLNPNLLTAEVKLDGFKLAIIIDISSDLVWVRKTSDDTSVILKQGKFVTEKCTPTGERISGDITFLDNNVQLQNISYFELTSQDKPCAYKSTLGLARKFNKNYFSIFELIKKKGISPEFSIRFNSYSPNNFNGELKFGSHETELFDISINRIECDLLDLGTRWAVVLQGLVFGSLEEGEQSQNGKVFYVEAKSPNFKKVDAPLVIDTLQKYVIAPKNFIKYFKDKIFKSYLDKGICTFRENIDEINAFYCSVEVVGSFPQIHFILNNFVLHLPFLFEKTDDGTDQYMFIIIEYPKISKWTFGNYIYYAYTLYFNDRGKTLNFLSKGDVDKVRIIGDYNEKEEESENKITSYEIGFGIIFFINIAGITLLLVSLFKQKVYVETQIIK